MNESTLVPREEMSDLDWLARNVHVWPAKSLGRVTVHGAQFTPYQDGEDEYTCDWTYKYMLYTESQWLASRAELQEKPSWAHAPEWAEYMAQSPNGHWEFFAVKPRAEGWWRHPIGERSSANNASIRGVILGDWRDTLEKRPEADPAISYNLNCEGFMPFVSVEDIGTASETAGQQYRREIGEIAVNKYNDAMKDAEFSMLQSDGVVNDSGGLIDRFILVKEGAATAKQPAPKGSGSPILGMVLADLTNRALEGKEKYGEPLLAHNGRNTLWDAYQEALDLAMYLRQAIEEQGK